MTKRMLIDATHAEETRVAVVEGTRLIDFDYESKVRKQLKGSIFLAKVTRVEPSLQAAFVNFGGNRHGFLPFSEIHTDYFRIPIADREALIAEQQAEIEARIAAEEAEEAAEAAAEAAGVAGVMDADDEADDEHEGGDEIEELGGELPPADTEAETTGPVAVEAPVGDHVPMPEDETDPDDAIGNVEGAHEAMHTSESHGQGDRQDRGGRGGRRGRGRGGRDRGRGRGGRDRGGRGGDRMAAQGRRVELIGGDGIEGDHPVRPSMRRNYKIQEVVKRGQIMLVQVAKEERGNKGAAVTTYLSLPGRYCVLMPNSPRGGGVSRKIANFKERRRMREILSELNVPEGMSVIMRTAGMSRDKAEIKRDLDYLMKLWDGIRDLTLQSTAPALVHEEGNLIRRVIRDIYGDGLNEVHVAGDQGYTIARDFMEMMMPSHVSKVHHYTDEKIPLFNRYQVETQIAAMGEPTVNLKSGGYLVINPTEALVSIDVNSGRATKERHIEETALKTNLEAAEEVARQLRLRDLGGLIVIDFIDMENRGNNRRVEERLKQALSSDRARMQVGRISSFGLLELSRQRLNPSLNEAQFEKCPHCTGIGIVRTVDSAAVTALRAVEEEGIRGRSAGVILNVSNAVALYILNNKRHMLADMERRYGFTILIRVADDLGPSGFSVEAMKGGQSAPSAAARPAMDPVVESDEDEGESVSGKDDGDSVSAPAPSGNDDASGEPRSRRRGRRGGRRRRGRDRGEGFGGNDRPHDNGNASSPVDSLSDEGGETEQPVSLDEGNQNVNGQGDEGTPEGRQNHQGRGRRRGGRGGRDRDRNPSGEAGDNRTFDAGQESSSFVTAPSVTEAVSVAPLAAPVRAVAAGGNNTPPPPRDYETVNEQTGEKRKGWWNKLME